MEDDNQPTPVSTVPEQVDTAAFESSMGADMGAVFDKMEKADERQAHRESPLSPPTEAAQPKDNLSATFEKAYDYLSMPKAEQDKLAAERAQIDEIKKFAADHGISLAEAQSLKGAQAAPQPGQLPAEFSKTVESAKALGYSAPFHEVTQRWADIDAHIRKDPVQGVAWLASQFDMNPLQLAQQLAVRFGDQQVIMSNAERMIEDFFDRNPGSADLQDLMLEAVESGAVRRTGHMASDLQTAFNYAQRAAKKQGTAKRQGKHLDRTMREAFDRANRR
jgi:hypothetical protein